MNYQEEHQKRKKQLKARAGIRRQIKLPNREAFKIAFRSIRIRFWRSMITAAGIVLAIAFLTYVLISGITAHANSLATTGNESGDLQERVTQVWLISISLLVCVVGITNAMLMSVTERFREIGTMKCLGALDWFIIKLFLIEAGFQGLFGSILGGVIGLCAALGAGMAQYGTELLSMLPWTRVFIYFFISILVGVALSIIGAVYPARRAGKMQAADAMRTEI